MHSSNQGAQLHRIRRARIPTPLRCAAAAVVLGSCLNASALADTCSWKNPADGNFSDARNWLQHVPSWLDDALFNLSSTQPYSVTLDVPGIRVFTVRSDRLNVSIPGPCQVHSLSVIPEGSESAELTISKGNFTASSGLGVGYQGTASMAITEAGSLVTPQLSVNGQAPSLLRISAGAKVDTVTGYVASSDRGEVAIDGLASVWTNSGTLTIGRDKNTNGSIAITNGGSLSSNRVVIGEQVGSTGFVTIDGPSSTWTTTKGTTVGDNGTGTMKVTNGATVSGSVNIAAGFTSPHSPSVGTVIVDGPGSTLQAPQGVITVAEVNVGTLSITAGGKVSAKYFYVSHGERARGTATVDGPGSTLTATETFSVGAAGTGELRITGGGSVFSTGAYVGRDSGTVTVTGAGSTWIDTGNLKVGSGAGTSPGTGTLNITAGASVSNHDGRLANMAGSSGYVTVDGPTSLWTNAADLFVGDRGYGNLTIANGGGVRSNGGFLGFTAASRGVVTVDGEGSAWITSAPVYIAGNTTGPAGRGDVTIKNGGTLRSPSPVTIWSPGSVSLYAGTIDAPTLIVNGTLSIYGNPNTLLAQLDSDITNSGTIYISTNRTAIFHANVQGPGQFTGTGTALFQATYSPGASPAGVSFAGNLAFADQATLLLELAGNTPGTQYDQITVTGQLAADGLLRVMLLGDYHPSLTDTFTLVKYASITGGFDYDLPSLAGGFSWRVSEGPREISLTVVPEPGSAMALLLASAILSRRRPRTD
ncbi:MAG: hypothetical protein NTU53_13475 [Planctomycetota bacterium]|nr:hypothetical protein [Planctomycetota bacterium]